MNSLSDGNVGAILGVKQGVRRMLAGRQYLCATNGFAYYIHPHHRQDRREKSRWTITPDEEFELFSQACGLGETAHRVWYLPDQVPETGLKEIGRSARDYGGPESLYIALFISGSPWHGYPADPEHRSQDVPLEETVQEWIGSGRLDKTQSRRLLDQMPWS